MQQPSSVSLSVFGPSPNRQAVFEIAIGVTVFACFLTLISLLFIPMPPPLDPSEGNLSLHYMTVVSMVTAVLCGSISFSSAVVHVCRHWRRTGRSRQRPSSHVSQASPWNPANVSLLGPHDSRVHEALSDGTIRLLRCSWLRDQPAGYVLSRRQDLPEEAFFSHAEAADLFMRQDRSVGVLSYGWLTALHCDPHGRHFDRVAHFLRLSHVGQSFEALFWDFGSLMQKDKNGKRTDHDSRIFSRALQVMAGLYASARGTSVLRLREIPESPDATRYNMTPYQKRGWPKLEYYAAMIMVGTEAETSAEVRAAAGLRVPKLLDVANGNAIDDIKEAPEPIEFERQLASCKFVGTSTVL
jgi:hypothetical protein